MKASLLQEFTVFLSNINISLQNCGMKNHGDFDVETWGDSVWVVFDASSEDLFWHLMNSGDFDDDCTFNSDRLRIEKEF